MFTKMAHEAFMKLKQVRRRSWGGGGYHIYIYRGSYINIYVHSWQVHRPVYHRACRFTGLMWLEV